jgi:hypothetical protein
MYFDEDGDLAHEFYEEIKVDDSQKTTMRQTLANLRPQASFFFFFLTHEITDCFLFFF